MKLKEYPASLYHSIKVKLIPVASLGKHSVEIDEDLIVTLTSIPSRLHIIHITIRSLLCQTVRPRLIVLWLNENHKNKIPASLNKLISKNFVIRFISGDSSHCKLIYALKEYEDSTLVVCDDDLIYPKDWLERLLKPHNKYPENIIGHECRDVTYNENHQIEPYRNWVSAKQGESKKLTIALGYGGALYPPNSLDLKVLDEELFMTLAPKADDLWFKAMAMLKGTSVRRSEESRPKPIPIINSQKTALGKTNIKQDGNRLQWQALVDYFDLN